MPVVHNASPDEFDSPFFIANQKICEEFDTYIVGKNGETRGKYNSYSYSVLGKIRHPQKWEFEIKKASYTSGNLLLDSKYQSLHTASFWRAKKLETDCTYFKIRRKKRWDFLLLIIFPKIWRKHSSQGKYVIKSNHPDHDFIFKLNLILKKLFDSNKIWEIEFENSELEIDLRSAELHTEIIDELLKM